MSESEQDLTVSYFNAGWKSAQDSATYERDRILKMLKVFAAELKKESKRLLDNGYQPTALKASYEALGVEKAIRIVSEVEDE